MSSANGFWHSSHPGASALRGSLWSAALGAILAGFGLWVLGWFNHLPVAMGALILGILIAFGVPIYLIGERIPIAVYLRGSTTGHAFGICCVALGIAGLVLYWFMVPEAADYKGRRNPYYLLAVILVFCVSTVAYGVRFFIRPSKKEQSASEFIKQALLREVARNPGQSRQSTKLPKALILGALLLGSSIAYLHWVVEAVPPAGSPPVVKMGYFRGASLDGNRQTNEQLAERLQVELRRALDRVDGLHVDHRGASHTLGAAVAQTNEALEIRLTLNDRRPGGSKWEQKISVAPNEVDQAQRLIVAAVSEQVLGDALQTQ